jgi:hypothetical protein
LSSIKPTTDGKMYFCSTYLMRKKYFYWKVLKKNYEHNENPRWIKTHRNKSFLTTQNSDFLE